MKNLDRKSRVLLLHPLTLKLSTKSAKTKQCSTETNLQMIEMLNITTNISINKW